jgi:trimeric autotransporter adhesin
MSLVCSAVRSSAMDAVPLGPCSNDALADSKHCVSTAQQVLAVVKIAAYSCVSCSVSASERSYAARQRADAISASHVCVYCYITAGVCAVRLTAQHLPALYVYLCKQGEATKRAAAAAAAAEAERQRFFFAASLGSKVHVDDDDIITVPPFDRELFTDDSTAAEAAAATAAAAAAAGTGTLLLESADSATAAAAAAAATAAAANSSDDAAEYSDALDGSAAATVDGVCGEGSSPQYHRPSVYTSVDISEEGWLDDLAAQQDAMQEQDSDSAVSVPVSALPLAEQHEHQRQQNQQQQQQQHISAAASQYLAAKSGSGYAGSECSSEGMQSEDEPLFRHLRDSTLDDSTAAATGTAAGAASGSTSRELAGTTAAATHSAADSSSAAPLQQSITAATTAAAAAATSEHSADTRSSVVPARLEPVYEDAAVPATAVAAAAELSTEEHALGISSSDEGYSDAVAAFASASPHAVLLQELQQCDTAALAVAAVAVAGADTASDARTAAIAALQAEVEQVEAAAAAAAAARRLRWAQEEAEDRARLQKKKSLTKVNNSNTST